MTYYSVPLVVASVGLSWLLWKKLSDKLFFYLFWLGAALLLLGAWDYIALEIIKLSPDNLRASNWLTMCIRYVVGAVTLVLIAYSQLFGKKHSDSSQDHDAATAG